MNILLLLTLSSKAIFHCANMLQFKREVEEVYSLPYSNKLKVWHIKHLMLHPLLVVGPCQKVIYSLKAIAKAN